MIVALLIVTGIFLILALLRKEKIGEGISLYAGIGTLWGMANGITNLLVMILAGIIPNALLFPSVSARGIVLGFIIAVTIYKERLSGRQLIGYAIETISVALLNM